MDAFKDRGKCDFYASADWEDIITVMDGRKEIRREIFQATNDVKEYLKKEIQEFSKSEFFHQSISGNLAPGPGLEERASRVLDILLNIP
jgi:hypothetical protein